MAPIDYEQHFPAPPEVVWDAFKETVGGMKKVRGVQADDFLRRAEFQTKEGVVIRGPDFTATVQPAEGGAILSLQAFPKSTGGSMDTNGKKYADEIIRGVSERCRRA